jgi:hypothetical protein
MERRTAVSRLAVALAGASLAHVSGLEALAPPSAPSGVSLDEVAAYALQQSGVGTVKCPACTEGYRWDNYSVTPAGVCVRCSALTVPAPSAHPESDPFWILSPDEISRADREIARLTTEAKRLEASLDYNIYAEWTDEEEARDTRIDRIARELFLLLSLREASRQFSASRSSLLA